MKNQPSPWEKQDSQHISTVPGHSLSRYKVCCAKQGTSSRLSLGVPAGNTPHLRAPSALPSSEPRTFSELSDSLQKARAGTRAAAKHLQTLRKVSARLGLSTKRLFLYHSIQASILCHIQPSPKKHLEAFHGYVDISIMLHLNRFCCAESYVLLKYFPFYI